MPYASRDYNPGLNEDFYALGMVFLGISTTVGAANFIVTAFRTRAPGHVDQSLADPGLGHADGERRQLDRRAGGEPGILPSVDGPSIRHAFFRPAGGGQPLLWQHLFWIFGHPWVYAIVLPAMGMVSDGLPVFCRRPLVGYSLVALSTVATMIFGFGVWVHHMFATGLPGLGLAFFSGASIAIVVPSAVAVFAWIATISPGPARHHHRVSILLIDDLAVRDRRRIGVHDGERAGRLAIDGYLFRGRSSALRTDRHQRLSRWSARSISGFRR